VVAKGGTRRQSNKAFATSTNRAPTQTQQGTRAKNVDHPRTEDESPRRSNRIANDGKSTLLSRVGACSTRDRGIPFTNQVSKQLGDSSPTTGTDRALVICRSPGLIEGAPHGRRAWNTNSCGMSNGRASWWPSLEPSPRRRPPAKYRLIRRELELYATTLLKNRSRSVSKCERTGSVDVRAE